MAQIKLLKISADGVPLEFNSAADEITLLTGQFGNVKLAGNSVTSEDVNGDLILTPNGTGDLVLDGVNWPQTDGLAGQFLTTDGAGQLSWANQADDLEARRVVNPYTADEALAARDAVYISGADNVSKADVSAAGAPSRVMGFATAAALDTAPVNVQSEGVLAGFSGLTAGARYYADPATPGGITATTPVGSGNTIVQVGYAKSATELHIHIEQLGRRA